MRSTNIIRPIALAVIRKDDTLLVFKVTEESTGREFYRPLGGGIEFGEKSEAALKREFNEEIGAEIKIKKLMDIIENVFIHEKTRMHEIVFLYEVVFNNQKWYKKNEIPIVARHPNRRAIWENIEKLKQANFYPEGIKKLI